MALASGRNRTGPRTVTASNERQLLSEESSSRKSANFLNEHATTSIFVGGADVTVDGATRGREIKAGREWEDCSSCSAWYVITDGTSIVVNVIEVF